MVWPEQPEHLREIPHLFGLQDNFLDAFEADYPDTLTALSNILGGPTTRSTIEALTGGDLAKEAQLGSLLLVVAQSVMLTSGYTDYLGEADQTSKHGRQVETISVKGGVI